MSENNAEYMSDFIKINGIIFMYEYILKISSDTLIKKLFLKQYYL